MTEGPCQKPSKHVADTPICLKCIKKEKGNAKKVLNYILCPSSGMACTAKLPINPAN